MSQMPSGCGGNTLGPPIFGLSSPLAASADVADHLGLHAEARPAREQPVIRILLDQLRRHAEATAGTSPTVTISRCSAF